MSNYLFPVYKTDFEDDLRDDGSDFHNFVSELLKETRPQTDLVDEKKACKDAEKLHNVSIVVKMYEEVKSTHYVITHDCVLQA